MEVRSRWIVSARGYLLAAVATTVAGFVRLSLSALFGIQAPFFPFVLAVLITARYGGLKPGLFATGLGAIVGSLLYVQPSLTSWTVQSGVTLTTVLFVIIGATASWLCGALHGARRHTEEAERALQEADQRKNEFLATLAHELRNPLAPMRNALELMQRAQDNPGLLDQVRGLLDRQLGHMIRLVDDLLDVSRIVSGKLELRMRRIELSSIIDSAVEAARPSIEVSAHELTVTVPSSPIYVDADAVRLAQVFVNLLTNAARYTDKSGHIWLTVEQHGKEVTISVRDTGIGIAAEHVSYIFGMYAQVPPKPERSQNGLGIGLSLVKGLVRLHGGDVEVHSGGVGLGSTFTVRLTVAEPPTRTSEAPMQGSALFQGSCASRILVVDDNQDAASSLATMLRLAGHNVHVAFDGLEALQAAAAVRPEIALLDIGLPKMDGYEVAHRIRRQSWGKDVILIAVTAWGQDDDRRRALQAGFDHHFVKPVEFSALAHWLINPKASPHSVPIPVAAT